MFVAECFWNGMCTNRIHFATSFLMLPIFSPYLKRDSSKFWHKYDQPESNNFLQLLTFIHNHSNNWEYWLPHNHHVIQTRNGSTWTRFDRNRPRQRWYYSKWIEIDKLCPNTWRPAENEKTKMDYWITHMSCHHHRHLFICWVECRSCCEELEVVRVSLKCNQGLWRPRRIILAIGSESQCFSHI